MQSLFARIWFLLSGVLVGVLGATTVLVWLKDDGAASDSHTSSTEEIVTVEPQSDVIQDTVTKDQLNLNSVPSDIGELVFPELAFNRKTAIYSWVSVLSDDQILSWLEQSVKPSWDEAATNRSELQSALLHKLTTTDPERAFEFAWAQDDTLRYELASIVLFSWASLDLDGATARLKKLGVIEGELFIPAILSAHDDLSLDSLRAIAKDLGDESYAVSQYFQNLSKGSIDDPETTWYEMIKLANDENVQDAAGMALGHVAAEWVRRDGEQVYDEILASISPDPNYDLTLPEIFGALAYEAPEQVFDYLSANLGDEALQVITKSGISYSWARVDPIGALTRAESLPASLFRSSLISSAVYEWADNNPQQLLESAELIPEADRELGRHNAIRSLVRQSPSQATAYVLQIKDFETQRQLSNVLVREWSYQDAPAMQEWVLGLSESNPLRSELLGPLAISMVETDPRSAFQLALAQPIEEQETSEELSRSYEAMILSRIAAYDVELAIELLPQVREIGSSKAYAYSSIGNELIESGDSDRAIELGSALSEDEQEIYFMSVASMWALSDPKAVLNKIDKLPTAKIQSSISLSLSLFNKMMNIYSAEEVTEMQQFLSEEDQQKLQRLQDIDLLNPSAEEVELLEEMFPMAW